MPITVSNWDATSFFERLTATNRLARDKHFRFCRVSGLQGFEDALSALQSTTAFVCVSDTAEGYTELNNTPRTRRVKTVFIAMRHKVDSMPARLACFDTMRELFRQYMSVLILESTKLQERSLYLDPRIRFSEIPEFFASGCACASFQVAVDIFTDLRYNADEWILSDPKPQYITFEHAYDDGKFSKFFTSSGNLSTSYAPAQYGERTFVQCLKMESSTKVTFDTEKAGILLLVFGRSAGASVSLDEQLYTIGDDGIVEIPFTAGSHTIAKGDKSSYLFYLNTQVEK